MDTIGGGFSRTSRPRGTVQGLFTPEDEYGDLYPEVTTVRKDATPLRKILSKHGVSVSEFLINDVATAKEEEKDLLWFHRRITRDTAVHILRDQGGQEGLFLVRESTSRMGDYVISIMHNNLPQHFQIQCLGDFYFQIDNGPLFQGLDQLINYYRTGANGLPTKLTAFCKGTTPPASSRRFGRSTPLHRATQEAWADGVSMILADNLCCSLDARNQEGRTALHDAAASGEEFIMGLLLDKNANINSKDSNGVTPLYTACSCNQPVACKFLMLRGADPTLRHPRTGWVPLHEAAMKGHIGCVRELVYHGAPCHPRSSDNDTPLDLARRYEHSQVVKFLQSWRPKIAQNIQSQNWYHGSMDRKRALEIIQRHGAKDGHFLLRSSANKPDTMVLSMAANSTVYNFEINNKMESYHIDDGPYFDNLEQLIDHYSRYDDGLPTQLLHPIQPPSRNDSGPPRVRPSPAPRPADLTSHHKSQGNRWESPEPPVSPLDRDGSVPVSPPPDLPGSRPSNKKTLANLFGVRNSDRTRKKEMERQRKELQRAIHEAPGGGSDEVQCIDASLIERGNEIGQGEFGSVLKGRLKEGNRIIEVALKTLHADHLQTGQKEFLREAKVMCGLDHPCIVKLMGVCLGPPMMLVQELVAMGAMLDYLQNDSVTDCDLKLWAAQIASGMMYLESKKFVHRDLAARNILLESKGQAKISDFGLSRATGANNDYYRSTTGGRWPVKWYAPESIYYGTFSHASDVWSFGVTLWEMNTRGAQPYGEKTGAEVIKQIENGHRLLRPEGCPGNVYEIMQKCWSYKPANRPTFSQLNEMFSEDPEYQVFYHKGVRHPPSRR